MTDALAEFLGKADDGLAQLDQALARLEQQPADWDALTVIFRKVHAIRTGSTALNLQRLQRVSSAAEGVLTGLRDGLLTISPELIGAMLAARDQVRGILAGLQATGTEPPDPHHSDEALGGVLAALGGGAIGGALAGAPGALPGMPVPSPRGSGIAAHMVSVPAKLLDNMVALVGELMLTRNQLLQPGEAGRAAPLQRLSQVTAALQDAVMLSRMQPIRVVWTGLPELLRDLAAQQGKTIELVVRGADTELDRPVLDMLREPLIQLVRNAALHGLETPAERRAAGKPESGRVTLRARHDAGHVVLEVLDNGRGLDHAAIRAAALADGLDDAALAEMPDAELASLLFRPRTGEGPGSGLDLVARHIEAVGGAISLRSTPGHTSVLIRVPANLSLFSVLVMEAGNERFGLPRTSVVRVVDTATLAAGGTDAVDRIEWDENDMPVLRLGGRLIPIVALADLLELDGPQPDENSRIVVLAAGINRVGLLVNAVAETDEIVARPAASLPGALGAGLFSGVTTLADGSRVTTLDPKALARACGIDIGAAPVPEPGEAAPGPQPLPASVPGSALDPAMAAGQAGPAALPPGAPRRVLLVEDSSFLCHALLPALNRAGYHVRTVDSGDRALALRDAGLHFDLLIADLELPDMDGIALLQALRGPGQGTQAADWRHVPAIAITHRADAAASAPGYGAFLPQPEAGTLLDAMGRCMHAPDTAQLQSSVKN